MPDQDRSDSIGGMSFVMFPSRMFHSCERLGRAGVTEQLREQQRADLL